MPRLTITDHLMRAEAAARDAVGNSMVKLRCESDAKWLRRISRAMKACQRHLDKASKMIDSGNVVTVFEGGARRGRKGCR